MKKTILRQFTAAAVVAVTGAAALAQQGTLNAADRQRRIEMEAELQSIATRHSGVERAFPMQAGREVRVAVRPDAVPDDQVPGLCAEIAREIEDQSVEKYQRCLFEQRCKHVRALVSCSTGLRG